MKIFFF